MAYLYTVAERDARPLVRWGFALPTPPAHPAPPVYLPVVNQSFAETYMYDRVAGSGDPHDVMSVSLEFKSYMRFKKLPDAARGVWTGSIFDCMAVCGAYYDRPHRRWGAFWFEHIAGGCYQEIASSIAYEFEANQAEYPDPSERWAVVAAGNFSGVTDIARALIKAGVPDTRINIYVSGTGNRGFAFGVDFATGLFGETTQQGGVLV